MQTTTRVPVNHSQEIRLRALGENLKLTRSQWAELLDELRTDSELARRIRERLTTARAEEIREATGCSWESACARAELERDAAAPLRCDICSEPITAGERHTDDGGEIAHTACVSGWFRGNFGRESLA